MASGKISRALLAASVGLLVSANAVRAADPTTLMISMWGFNGDKLQAYLFKPFEQANNVKVVLEEGNAGDRLNKVEIRKGGVDLIYLSDIFSQVGIQNGDFETIDRSKIPNVADLYPITQAPQGTEYGPAYTLGRYGIVYDSAKVKTPITTWKDLWRPEFKNALSLPGFNTTAGPLAILFAADKAGVDPFVDPAPAFKSLGELKPNLVKTYNTGSELVNLFSTGEIVVAAAQDFTFPSIKAALPTAKWAEITDAYATFNTINIVKGTKNRDLALAFINWHLGVEVQKNLAVAGTDAPANTKVQLTPEQAAPWTYGEAVIKTLKAVDYAKINKVKANWSDRWNDTFGR